MPQPWPAPVENVRRRADGQAGEQFILAAPGLAAATVGADGQVGDQADAHATASGGLLGAFQAARDQPLAEGVEADVVAVFLGEAQECRALRAAPLLWPMAPVEVFASGGTRGLDRFETAVVLQGFTARLAETEEVGVLRVLTVAEVVVQGTQQAVFGLGCGGPVDQGVLFEGVQLVGQTAGLDGIAHLALTQDAAGRCVQAIEKQTARRRVRAVALGVGAEHRVHRADRQGVGPAFGGRAGQVFQRQGVAEPAVAEAAQGVQLGAQAPGTWGLTVDGIGDAVAVTRATARVKAWSAICTWW